MIGSRREPPEGHFELGSNRKKYEPILIPAVSTGVLLVLRSGIGAEVLEHPSVRQPSRGFFIRVGETEVQAEDVQV